MSEIVKMRDLIINAKRAHYDYLKEQELEATQREIGIANIKLMTYAIQEKREIAESFSKVFFDERMLLRESAEKSLEKAIETGDADMAEITLKFIEIVYTKNPFLTINELI